MSARGKCTKPRSRATYQDTLSRTALSSTEPRTNLCKDFPVPAVSRRAQKVAPICREGRRTREPRRSVEVTRLGRV